MELNFTKELYAQFGTDPELEKKGIVLDLGEGLRFQLARAGGANKKFTAMVEVQARPHRRQIDDKTVKADVMNQIMRVCIAHACILGWEGVTQDGPLDEDGKPTKVDVPFTPENAIAFFTEFPDIFQAVMAEATSPANYRPLSDDEKN